MLQRKVTKLKQTFPCPDYLVLLPDHRKVHDTALICIGTYLAIKVLPFTSVEAALKD